MYRRRCAWHTRQRRFKVAGLDATVCENCGWRGACHRHRIEPAKGYVAGNLQVFCPNCHAASHGHGAWNHCQRYDAFLNHDAFLNQRLTPRVPRLPMAIR